VARRLLGDLAYHGEAPEEALADCGVLLMTERSRQGGKRQQVEIALASLKLWSSGSARRWRPRWLVGVSGHQDRREDRRLQHLRLPGQPCRLGRPQGRIKELWA
jgi:hypothetical protein